MPRKDTASSCSSSRPPSESRPRFSRTKTGCATCRGRRKKCDEARDPHTGSCGRCKASGIECLGFPPLRKAPASAYRKQDAAQARQQDAAQARQQSTSGTTAGISSEPIPIAKSPLISSYVHPDTSQQIRSLWPEEGIARWADLMALDDGEQLFYEGMFFDASLRDAPLDKVIPSTVNSSRAISAEISLDTGIQPHVQIVGEQAEASKQDDRAMTCLSNFYAMICWYRWQPLRRDYTKDQLASALKNRLQRSEVLCISVAAVAACYGFGNFVATSDNSIKRIFLKHWDAIYHVVTSTKTRNLCAFLEWLGETSSNGAAGHKHIAAAQTMRQGTGSSQGVNGEGQIQRDNLFSLASRVLHEIAVAANQDQELPTNRSMPLDSAALVHVDKYLQAAMDLATLSIRNLLGRNQCVSLSDLQGIDTTGFKSFAWADIINAVLTGRCTLLHYVSDGEASRLRHDARGRCNDEEREPGTSELENDSDDDIDNDDGLEAASISSDGLQISFGCPDDVLVMIASIANLHFQLLHARKTGALPGHGPETMPAWGVHTALELSTRLRLSQQEADNRQKPSSRSKYTSLKSEHYALGIMWRHAAMIVLHTTAYRQGPLAHTNQEALHAILAIWSEGSFKPMTIAMGIPAMPLLVASFVAVSKDDRRVCQEALDQIGQRECGRSSYRRFVQRLWNRCDETGFGMLWQDLIPEAEEALAIL